MARKILLGLATEGKDQVAEDLKDVGKDLDELKREVTADVRVDAEEAKRDIKETLAELKALPREKTIRIRVEAEQAKLAALEKRLAALGKQRGAVAGAGGDTSALTQRMGSVAQQIEGVRGRLEGLSTDLERAGTVGDNAMAKVARGLTKVDTGLQDALGHIPLVGGLLSSVAEHVSTLVTRLLPDAADGFAAVASAGLSLFAVAPVVLAVAAAVAALVVSLGQALIGVAALATAFLAALAPIVLLLGLVAYHIMKAISGTNALAQAQAGLKTAYDTLAQSVVTLHNAQQQQSLQRIAALADEKTATLALTDAENAQKDALLGVTSAKLAAQSARLALAQFNLQLAGFGMKPGDLEKRASTVDVTTAGQQQTGADPLGYKQLLLQYQQAVLAVKTADQGVHDATAAAADSANTLALAHAKVNLYLKMGLEAYPAYLQAVQSTASAVNAWKVAENGLATAILARDQAAKGISSSASAFMSTWTAFKASFATIFGPAEQAVFAGISKALSILAAGMKPLEPAFKALGKAIGGAFVGWAKAFTQPAVMAGLKQLILGAAALTTKWAPGMNALLTILLDVANAAMPALLRIVGKLSKEFESAARHPKQISEFIKKCIGQTVIWWHGFELIVGVLLGIAKVLHPILIVLSAMWDWIKLSAQGWVKIFGWIKAILNLTVGPLVRAFDAIKSIASDIVSAFSDIVTLIEKAVGLIPGVQNFLANDLGIGENTNTQANAAYVASGTEALAKKDAGLLKGGGITQAFRKSLQVQLRNLGFSGAQIAQLIAAAAPRMLPAGAPGSLSPATASHIHHNTFTLQHGNTIQSDQHFSAAIERRLAANGTGYR